MNHTVWYTVTVHFQTEISWNLFLGVSQLAIILSEEQEDHIKAATVWALGQIGGHTPEHAKAIAVSNVLPRYDS